MENDLFNEYGIKKSLLYENRKGRDVRFLGCF